MSLRSAFPVKKLGAAAVHILTASGGVLGLFALLAASNSDWTGSFAWLAAALIVDGVDGPLARRLNVKTELPRFSGETLDLTVDYLTYVTVPAFIAARSEILPEGFRLPLAGLMMLVSLYHFADTRSKTSEGYFVGFPAIWNVLILACFVLNIPPAFAAALIAFCAFLTFVPLYWVHPLRVRRLRPLTFIVVLAWAAATAAVLFEGFPGTSTVQAIYVVAAVYSVAVGLSAGMRSA